MTHLDSNSNQAVVHATLDLRHTLPHATVRTPHQVHGAISARCHSNLFFVLVCAQRYK